MTCWVTVSDPLSNAKALVDTVADTVPEIEELSKSETRGGSQALVDALADTLAEVEAVTTAETLGDAQALNYLVGDTWRHNGQCAGSGQHRGLDGTRDGRVVTRRHTGRCAGIGGSSG